jgi:hypothetical protein
LKIPLRTKVSGWYIRKGVILTKDNLAKRNWFGSKKCVFYHHEETIKHIFFQYRFARSIWSVIHHLVLPIFLGIDLIALIIGLKSILGWEQLPLFGCYGYVEIKCLMVKKLSCVAVICRLTSTLRLWSSLQLVENRDLFIELCAQLKATTRDIFFPKMGDRIACASELLLHRWFYNFSLWYSIIFPFYLLYLNIIYILIIQVPDDKLNLLSKPVSTYFFKKIYAVFFRSSRAAKSKPGSRVMGHSTITLCKVYFWSGASPGSPHHDLVQIHGSRPRTSWRREWWHGEE